MKTIRPKYFLLSLFLCLVTVYNCDACESSEEEPQGLACPIYDSDCRMIGAYACSESQRENQRLNSPCEAGDAGIIDMGRKVLQFDSSSIDVDICVHNCTVECSNPNICSVFECIQLRCNEDAGSGDIS